MFTNVWSKIAGLVRSRKSASGNKAQKRPLSLESLEDRRLLSINPSQINLLNSNLLITGSDAADVVTVTEAEDGIVSVRLESGGDSLTKTFPKSQVQLVSFFGKEGNDQFSNSTDVATKAYGDEGNDSISGGSGADSLYGGDGVDTIVGGDGNDKLYGEAGDDLLNGQGGDDSLWGGLGNDDLYGGQGEDRLLGEDGNDQLFGQAGNDSLVPMATICSTAAVTTTHLVPAMAMTRS
jgi:hypothetical protein